MVKFPSDEEYDKLLPPNNNPYKWGYQEDEYINFEYQKSRSHESAQELLDLMTSISTEAWFAGWMNGTEFVLWDAALGKQLEWGGVFIDQKTGEKLKSLSDSCGGWWIYHRGERFLSLEEWQNLYE
ncbi:hypothetical protein [Nostoc sp. GT001]|uniref:hypothetical protein n=1 Tax=Nostoc sp. GT001 TaxID=3056647 RepID=UPI0025AB35EF|nr:hypothetical protein [Nostoc sp. GT001]MDM9583118.1 hypothetical protein [Nostoc sp. GT001]